MYACHSTWSTSVRAFSFALSLWPNLLSTRIASSCCTPPASAFLSHLRSGLVLFRSLSPVPVLFSSSSRLASPLAPASFIAADYEYIISYALAHAIASALAIFSFLFITIHAHVLQSQFLWLLRPVRGIDLRVARFPFDHSVSTAIIIITITISIIITWSS